MNWRNWLIAALAVLTRPFLAQTMVSGARVDKVIEQCLDGHRGRPVLDLNTANEGQAQNLKIRPETRDAFPHAVSKRQNGSGPERTGQSPI